MHSAIIKWIVLRQKNQMFLSWRPGADRVSAPSTLQTMAEIVTVSRSRLDTAFCSCDLRLPSDLTCTVTQDTEHSVPLMSLSHHGRHELVVAWREAGVRLLSADVSTC